MSAFNVGTQPHNSALIAFFCKHARPIALADDVVMILITLLGYNLYIFKPTVLSAFIVSFTPPRFCPVHGDFNDFHVVYAGHK